MNDKTRPVIGNAVIEEFESTFLKEFRDETGQVEGILYWPAKLIEETYRKTAAAIGKENEAQALKTFYSEMVHFFRTACYSSFDVEEEHYILTLSEGVDP